MIKVMSKKDIALLKQPCKNRNLNIVDNSDGSVTIDGKVFGRMRDCEDYLIGINRVY